MALEKQYYEEEVPEEVWIIKDGKLVKLEVTDDDESNTEEGK